MTCAGWCDAVRRSVARGLSLVQVRSPQTDPGQLRYRDRAALRESLSESSPQVRVLVNGDPQASAALDVAGVHLTSQRLWQFDEPPGCSKIVCWVCRAMMPMICARPSALAQISRCLGPVARTEFPSRCHTDGLARVHRAGRRGLFAGLRAWRIGPG